MNRAQSTLLRHLSQFEWIHKLNSGLWIIHALSVRFIEKREFTVLMSNVKRVIIKLAFQKIQQFCAN